jgi:hypothetical protein
MGYVSFWCTLMTLIYWGIHKYHEEPLMGANAEVNLKLNVLMYISRIEIQDKIRIK